MLYLFAVVFNLHFSKLWTSFYRRNMYTDKFLFVNDNLIVTKSNFMVCRDWIPTYAPLLCHRKDKSLSNKHRLLPKQQHILQSFQLQFLHMETICLQIIRQIRSRHCLSLSSDAYCKKCTIPVCKPCEKLTNCDKIYKKNKWNSKTETLLSHQSSWARIHFTSVNWDTFAILDTLWPIWDMLQIYDKLLFMVDSTCWKCIL